MTIDDELKALLMMSTRPTSWETFVAIVYNVSATTVKYSEITSSILSSRGSFSYGGWTFHKRNLMLACGPKVHSMYPLDVMLREGDLFLVDILVSTIGMEDLAT